MDEDPDQLQSPQPKESKRIRVGIIGGGRGGTALLEVLLRVPVAQVAAVCDINPGAPALKLAQRLHIPAYTDSSELILNCDLDWLINVSHASITQRHLLSRNLEGLTVVDGATAELIWRVLVDTDHHLDVAEAQGCEPNSANRCIIPLVWSVIGHIVESQQQLQRELTEIAFRDPLTGLYTRRVLMDYLMRELQGARRHGHCLSVLLVDVDHFKGINDTYGHAAGDDVLRDLSRLLEGAGRGSDLVARIGGEEFAVILPFTSTREAFTFADRLRLQVSKEIQRPDGQPLTISIGTVSIDPERPTSGKLDAAKLLSRADHALYRAKENGRNQVAMFGRD